LVIADDNDIEGSAGRTLPSHQRRVLFDHLEKRRAGSVQRRLPVLRDQRRG
jgi:hypothetical protein